MHAAHRAAHVPQRGRWWRLNRRWRRFRLGCCQRRERRSGREDVPQRRLRRNLHNPQRSQVRLAQRHPRQLHLRNRRRLSRCSPRNFYESGSRNRQRIEALATGCNRLGERDIRKLFRTLPGKHQRRSKSRGKRRHIRQRTQRRHGSHLFRILLIAQEFVAASCKANMAQDRDSRPQNGNEHKHRNAEQYPHEYRPSIAKPRAPRSPSRQKALGTLVQYDTRIISSRVKIQYPA